MLLLVNNSLSISLLLILSFFFTVSAVHIPKSTQSYQRTLISRSLTIPIVTQAILQSLLVSKVSAAPSCSCNKGSNYCTCTTGTFLTSLNLRQQEEDWYNPNNQRIYDTLHQSFVPAHPEQFLSKDLSGKKIIAIGEVHTNPCHHRLEFEVVRSLAELKGSTNLAIGLECFYRQHQNALDRFVFKHHDLATLKYDTKWDETWGYDLNSYAKLFQYASKNKIRLIGLNVPSPVAQLVSDVGLNDLPTELKELLPEIDLSNKEHKERFYAAIGSYGHSTNPTLLERMYQTQTLWDEYMSESAANYVKYFPDATLVVIAGVAHIQGRVGIPDRIEKRINEKPFVIVPQQVSWSSVDGLPEITKPLSRTDCDWAWYTQKELLTASSY